MTTSPVVRIPAVNLDRLQDEVATMNRRAERLSLAPLVLTVDHIEQVKKVHPETRVAYVVEYAHVSISGESPVLNGWRLIAKKTPVVTGEGSQEKWENLLQTVPGMECPQEYRFNGMECDHCRTSRRRNDTFILQHDDGRYAQVGRNCLADFLGHQSPEAMLQAAEWLFDSSKLMEAAGDEGWGFGSGLVLVPTGLFLAVVSVVIHRIGWVSKGEAQEDDSKTATAGIVWNVITRPNDDNVKKMIQEYGLQAEEQDGILADAALTWARAIPTTAVDYLYNLGVQCRRTAIDWKASGMVASAISAYQRHLDREEKAKAPQYIQQHVGTVDVREGFPALTVKATKSFDSEYGVRTLVRFQDAQGNVLIWWTGEPPDWVKIDATVDITATVKEHAEYQGRPQTVLTRCKEGLPKPKGKRAKKAVA